MIISQITLVLLSKFQAVGKQVLYIMTIAIAAHILVLVVKKISKLIYAKTHKKATSKFRSITSLVTSTLVFIIYFWAIGYSLQELGISLTAYIASASVIGLAVAFGSQGIVQDLVTGITLILSNQIDIDDMVEINGQVGVVRSIGMRFVVFENALGAKVYIPNRNIIVVINYPKKHINCQVDIILPKEEQLKKNVKEKVNKILKGVFEKYPSIFVLAKPQTKTLKKNLDNDVFRLTFHIWPGRGAPIETTFKQELIIGIKAIHPSFEDWMISVYYEIEKEVISDDKQILTEN